MRPGATLAGAGAADRTSVLTSSRRRAPRWPRAPSEVALPPDAEHWRCAALTGKLCAAAAWRATILTAQAGYECRHNLTYWRNEPWLGLGAGAWSYLEGERRANLREAGEYCAALETGAEPTEIAERPEPEAALLEAVMMGLRLTEGMRIESLEATHGERRS